MDDRARSLELVVNNLAAKVDQIRHELDETNRAVQRAADSAAAHISELRAWQQEERARQLKEYQQALEAAEKKRLADVEEARQKAELMNEVRHLTTAIKTLSGTEDGLRTEVKRRTDREEGRKTLWEWGDILVTAAAKSVPLAFLILGGLWALFTFLIDINAIREASGQ